MKVGFIGLGHMGAGMAPNLLRVGHEVTIYNRTAGKERALIEHGARAATHVADACRDEVVITMPRLRPEVIPSVPENPNTHSADHAEAPPPAAPARLSWARLLTKPPGAVLNGERRRAKAMDGFRKRVFDIDLEHCPHCGGPLKIIAAIVDSTVIAKILVCLSSMIFIYCCLDVVGR